MYRTLLKSKIHRAVVTEANLQYVGSITIDPNLMRAADLIEYEKVLVANVDNGQRLETYVITGEAGKGDICLNGAAARLVSPGDRVIIMAFAQVEEPAPTDWQPTVVFVDERNRIMQVAHAETAKTTFADAASS